VLSVVAVACLVFAAPAGAQEGAARLAADCQDDRIDGSYTQAEFEAGLRALPTDIDEYSACRETIRRAQLRAAGGAGGAEGAGTARPRAAAPDGSADAGAVAGARASSGRGGGSGASAASAGRGGSGGPASGSGAASGPAAGAEAADASASPGAADPAAAAGGAAPPSDAAAEASALGTAVTGVGRAATPAVTAPATARVLSGVGALLLVALAAAFWVARRAQARAQA
jgi:hypothetical protein